MSLTADRDTKERRVTSRVFPMAAVKIYAGALVMVTSGGNATPGAASTTSRGVGRAKTQVDNSGGSAGDLSIEVEVGTFKYDNSTSADLIAKKDIGANCYIVSDSQVALTNGSTTRSVAGTVADIDSDGSVWVKFT